MDGEKLWFTYSHRKRGKPQFYTVYYCKDCGQQRIMYSSGYMKYKCESCDALYLYEKDENRLRLIRHGVR